MKWGRGCAACLVAVAVVLGAGLIGGGAIVDAESHRVVTDAGLVVPGWYVIFAPVCTFLDALTLLSVRQHVAVIGTLFVVVLVWRTVVHRSRGSGWRREVGVGVLTLVGLIVVYAAGALVPRPMAAIAMRDRDDVVVDFHSHTNASWDGRRAFTAEWNRRWHRASGFDVAYVSDHNSVKGALQGVARNPRVADGGTILLPAVELRDRYEHINAIGIDTAAPPDAKGEWHDPPGDTMVANRRAAPLLILTIPGNLKVLPENEVHGVARLAAVELSDGAPRGIGEIQRHEGEILALANRLGLAVVAGSDNHGWGSTAAGWSVLHIPGWRGLRPAQLDSAIQQTIRDKRRTAVRVYVRDTPNPGASRVALTMTVPTMVWRMVVDLTWPERAGWILWILVVGVLTLGYNSVWEHRRTNGVTRTGA